MFPAVINTLLFFALTINSWQAANYNELVKRLSSPSFPSTTLNSVDDNSITYMSYAAVDDPGAKYSLVMHDSASVPSWLFIMRYKNEIKDELWHRGIHFDQPCNTWQGDNILLHINTVGLFKVDIIFKLKYKIIDTKNGIVIIANMDKTAKSENVQDFNMLIWAFPHPTVKNLVIIVTQGYIRTALPIAIFKNNIKWHIDNMLQNFGDRVITVKND